MQEFLNKNRIVSLNVPQQNNGYDCGLYVTKFVEHILIKWPFNKSDVETLFEDFDKESCKHERKLYLQSLETEIQKL